MLSNRVYIGDAVHKGDSYPGEHDAIIDCEMWDIHRRGPWRSFEAVEFATLTWVEWFNNRRLLEPIGKIPPAVAEEPYYAMLENPAIAA